MLAGRHLDMSTSDICLEIKVQQPIAAKPEAATIACYCFATNPPAAVFVLLHSNIYIFVNITGAQVMGTEAFWTACHTCSSQGGYFLRKLNVVWKEQVCSTVGEDN